MPSTSTGFPCVQNAYTLVFAGPLLLGARSGDLLGRHRVLLAGMVVFVLRMVARLIPSRWLARIEPLTPSPDVTDSSPGRSNVGAVQVHDLGPLELSECGMTRQLGQRPALVLGRLLCAEGPVAGPVLAELCWPGQPVSQQRANLQVAVSRLRTALDSIRMPVPTLIWDGSGYLLSLPREAIDSERFLGLGDGLYDVDGTDPDAALAQTDEALQLWRGPFLDGLSAEPWAHLRRDRLSRARHHLLDWRWTTLVARGRAQEVVDETQADVDFEGAVWERRWEHQLRALIELGLPSAAHRAYLEAERALLERNRRPGAALVRLHHRARAADRRAWPVTEGLRVVERPDAEPRTQPAHFRLPPLLTELVGRDEDLVRTQELLAEPATRLLSLLGPGGVGKTSLALELARTDSVCSAFPDGVVWIDLTRVRRGDSILAHISASLKFEPKADTGIDQRLARYLTGRELLVILDNVEQLVDGIGAVADLLGRCPELKVLVTSRRALDIDPERRYWVSTLTPPTASERQALDLASRSPALQVLVRRARETAPNFQLSSVNVAALGDICAELDGLPLALELAASRLALFTPPDLLNRLRVDSDIVSTQRRDRPERQRTLRTTLDWSYQLLTPEEQTAFGRLAIFHGSFDYEAAEAVALSDRGNDLDASNDLDPSSSGLERANTPAVDVLESLITQSLLRRTDDDGRVRFRLLETVRHYAAGRLDPSEQDLLADRHLAFYLALAERGASTLSGPDRLAGLALLDQERPNLRAAFRHAVTQGELALALRLANALGWLWYFRGPLTEGRAWFAEVFATHEAAAAASVLRATGLWHAGRLAHLQGTTGQAGDLLEQSVQIWRSQPGREHGLAYALSDLGQVRWMAGDHDLGRRLAQESVRLFRRAGDRWGLALALQDLGQDVLFSQDLVAARELYEEILAIFEDLGDNWGRGLPLLGLGRVAMAAGDTQLSGQSLQASRQIFEHAADRRLGAFVVMRLGQLARQNSDVATATRYYRQALQAWRELDHEFGVALAVAGLAGTASLDHRDDDAALLAGAASAIMRAENRQMTPLDRADHEPYLSAAKSRLGPARFDLLHARGRGLSRPELLAVTERKARAASPPAHVRVGLTNREREITRLAMEGLSYRQIAEALFITQRTVGFHLGQVYQKLGVANRHELTAQLRIDGSPLIT